MLRKLDRRLIAYASIPQELISRLAQVIQREATTVAAYLWQDPTLGATTEHRSEQAPISSWIWRTSSMPFVPIQRSAESTLNTGSHLNDPWGQREPLG